MKERDNRDIQFTHLAMENVRLQNLVREYEEEFRLRDEEDAAEKAQMAELLASKDRQIAAQAALIESQKKDITRIAADRDQEREGRIKAEEEKKAVVIELNQLRQEHDEKMKELQPAKEMLAEAEKSNLDCQAVIKMMLNREYNTNSDARRYMDGEFRYGTGRYSKGPACTYCDLRCQGGRKTGSSQVSERQFEAQE